MDIHQIAKRLHGLASQRMYEQAQRELYSEDAVSVEPPHTRKGHRNASGKEDIIQKGDRWESQVTEWHENIVSEPLVAGAHIAMKIMMDVTMSDNVRRVIDEIAVYTVQGDKIVKEQFLS